MGVAAYNRGSAALARQLDAEQRPREFRFMDDLNRLPKYEDAGTPFGPIHFVWGNNGWWAQCPTSGYGFWYATLREAVRRWRVCILAYEHGTWKAIPDPQPQA